MQWNDQHSYKKSILSLVSNVKALFLENIKNGQNTPEMETNVSNIANKFTVNAFICYSFNVCINFMHMSVHVGSSAQHRRRVTGLFPWWSVSLWGGGSCPKDQPCGDPCPLWPLRRNPQTPTEHHQCQVVCCKCTRGQSVPICYMTMSSFWEIVFRSHPAGTVRSICIWKVTQFL